MHDVNASGGTGADVITMLQRLRRGGGARRLHNNYVSSSPEFVVFSVLVSFEYALL